MSFYFFCVSLEILASSGLKFTIINNGWKRKLNYINYVEKTKDLFGDINIYKLLKSDPTSKFQNANNQLINKLQQNNINSLNLTTKFNNIRFFKP